MMLGTGGSWTPSTLALVGRDEELESLIAQLRAAHAGSARVVLVSGEAGIGKTRLCRALLERAEGFLIATATGEESESGLAYGVLDQLLGGLGAPPVGDATTTPLSAGAEIVRRLSDAQTDGPILVWVDDLQWADLPSQQALLFALRRLEADTVCAVLCVRSPEEGRVLPGLVRLAEEPTGSQVHLSGLELGGLSRLAEGFATPLPSHALVRLRSHTGGNPLWTTALLRELTVEELLDSAAPLPAPRSFAAITTDRLRAIGTNARSLVETCAVAGGDSPLGTLSEAGEVTEPFVALEEAIEAGLLVATRAVPPQVRTSHSLVASAVYGEMDLPRRARLHTALARLALTEFDRLRHEIAASPGHDGALAARVAALGQEQAGQGAWSTAADTLQAAANLSPARDERSGLLEEAAAAALMAGDPRHAAPLCSELSTYPATPRTHNLLGWLALAEGRHADAERLLLRATRESAKANDAVAEAEASRLLAHLHVLLGRADEAVAPARRAVALSPTSSPAAGAARGVLYLALSASGGTEDVLKELSFLDDLDLRPDIPALTARGLARLWTGDLAGCIQDLSRVAAASMAVGAFEFTCSAHAELGAAFHLCGDWDAAIEHGQRAVGVVEDGDLGWALAAVHAHAVPTLARRGMVEEAERHLFRALRSAARSGDAVSVGYAATAAAIAAHSRHDFAGVLRAVAPVLALTHRVGIGEPGNLEWPTLYFEALLREGHVGEADTELTKFETAAAALGRPWPLAAAARVRGLVETARNRHDEAMAAFGRAAAHAESAGTPFELALVHLHHGEALRRLGRRPAATENLTNALNTFRQLGAVPFARIAVRELDVCGVSPPQQRASSGSTRLTPQELTVARLVRRGLSNRDIAAELFISAKTVEFHLRNAFMKLGVGSRTQLVARLAES